MKTKSLTIIFVVFLSITLASGLAVFLTKEKSQPTVNEQSVAAEKQAEFVISESTEALKEAPEKKATPQTILAREDKNIKAPQTVKAPAEERIKAVMIIGGDKYETAVKPGSSVYDLMNLLKAENKIDFSGEYYAGLGFFVEALNGLKNNPAGKNWVYYINGKPAPVGISNYELKNNDTIEWKYENKSF